jgi:hypothetical protein
VTKHEIVHLVDDLDGEAADERVTFGLDGKTYEIDLSSDHAATLRGHLSAYVAAARRAPSAPTGRVRPHGRTNGDGPRSRSEGRAMRAWARDNGFQLSNRGRIPAAVVAAYREAGASSTAISKSTTAQPTPPRRATADESASNATDPRDADVLAWHEAKNYKVPADRVVTGLMRHRYRTAHEANG